MDLRTAAGDRTVGLLGAPSATLMGSEPIIAMSRHETRRKLALECGAIDIVTERDDEGVARIKDMINGYGADSMLERVGTQESMVQAIRSIRQRGSVSYVCVPHAVEIKGEELFFPHIHLQGGPAPMRRYLPKLIEQLWERKINPGNVFDLHTPPRPSGGGLSRDGRTSRDQDAAASIDEGACAIDRVVERSIPQDRGGRRLGHRAVPYTAAR